MIIIFSLLIFTIVAILKRDWALYLIILLLPSYQIRFQLAGIPMTFLEGMILILAGVTLLSLRASHEASAAISMLRNDKLVVIFTFLFLVAALLSVFVSPLPIKAAGIFKAYFFEAVLFYFLVRLIINSPKKLERLFTTLAILVLYISIYGLYQFITLYNLPPSWWAVDVASRRITSVLNHPNAVALLLGPILAMLIIRQPKNKPTWAAIILGLAAFYLSFSRAGWLALAATVIFFSYFKLKKYNAPAAPPFKLRGGWGALLGIMGIIILIFTIPFSRSKLLDLTNKSDPSRQNRTVLWSAAADMLKKSPILGVGLMGFREQYKNYPLGPDHVIQNYPHNFFLNFWLETSLLGLVSIIGLLIIFYKKIYILLKDSKRSPELSAEDRLVSRLATYALAAAAGMVMIVLHSLVDVSYFKNDLSVLFWLIYALPNLSFLSSRA